jgi:hypothetical protein
MSMHRSAAPARPLSRLLALWLVVLIALPFTAPFQTLDLGAASSEAGVDAAADKYLKLPAGMLVVPPRAAGVAGFDVRPFSCGSDYYRILPTVLRL